MPTRSCLGVDSLEAPFRPGVLGRKGHGFTNCRVLFGARDALIGGMADSVDVPIRPLLLKVPEAAAVLGVGRSTVYELIGAGELETVHIRRACRIPVVALDDYVSRLRSR